ncbi:MAG: hypothetical protein ABFD91_06365 [Anaerohalosphaeraceae bacterium]
MTDRNLELTGFQDGGPYNPYCDFRNDFAMVYGADNPNLPEFIKSWVDKGYVPQLMTGIAWGAYADFRDLKGNDIMSLSQVEANGSQKLHGHRVPYIVPSIEFADYMSEKLKTMIDAGVVAIHLEEPEFWAYTGFSEAFQREWQLYYDTPFVRPDTSADAQYKASQLKYYLFGRTLRRVAETCKEYALQKYNRKVRFYVPTHSLINYTQWCIVSPQSSLIDSDVIDGCIAQIWTGTSRTPNVYQGQRAERTFETAFLEYGVMQELVRNTNRRMWFLHDPIEDNPRYDWNDYQFNYKATLIASLLHPHVWHYEICPWPPRVFRGKYPAGAADATPIPADYATILCTVFNQLRDMNQPDSQWISSTHGIGVLIADSGMFQRAEPAYRLAEGNGNDPTKAQRSDIRDFSGFYGLALPLLKHGIPVQPVQLDNTARFANYLNGYQVLVLSYEFMKPQTPAINQALAEWTAKGGALVYVGADTDPFNTVSEWWNSGKTKYDAPSQHLMELLGLSRIAADGKYAFGKGHVFVARKHPAYYTRSKAAADEYRAVVKQAAEAVGLRYIENNFLQLNRGPYMIAACLEDSISDKPLELKGLFVDIFNAELPVCEAVSLKPGQCTWLLDLNKLQGDKAEPVASAARIETWKDIDNGVEFTLTSPKEVNIVSRIRLPKQPAKMTVDGREFDSYVWDEKSRTVFFKSPMIVDSQLVTITW